MKKLLFIAFLLTIGVQTTLSQSYIFNLKDDKKVVYDMSEVESISFSETDVVIHEWVDLGLPSRTLWATCNIGAKTPEEYGTYFAWGDTEGNGVFNFEYYKFCDYPSIWMSKYDHTSPGNGCDDGKTFLDAEDDAATVLWGSEWRMPSIKQIEELVNPEYTYTEWTTQNGINGLKVTSKRNGNSIFLPAGGDRTGWIEEGIGEYGYYWSRSLSSGSYGAGSLFFNSERAETSGGFRYFGQNVRPVCYTPSVLVSSIDIGASYITLSPGETRDLTATVLPVDAENPSVYWDISGAGPGVGYLVIDPSEDRYYVLAEGEGTMTITCRACDGSGVYAECIVNIRNTSGTADGHDWIDLGLPSGTRWATCNVGANAPEEYGGFYAWGETETKDLYSETTYRYQSGNTFTKYNNTDKLTELEPEDDAATANWGTNWQMPSQPQMYELFQDVYTTKEIATQNGVKGLKITSKQNGQSIFLPAASYHDYDVDYDENDVEVYYDLYGGEGEYGFFWTRTRQSSSSWAVSRSFSFYYDEETKEYDLYSSDDSDYRYKGLSVRPVCHEEREFVEWPASILTVTKTLVLTLTKKPTGQLRATVSPSWAYNKSVTWESNDESVATVDAEGLVTAVGTGNCIVTCRTTDGSNLSAECQVKVLGVTSGTAAGREWVDLGFDSGTLWATCNVGATSPEQVGGYYAWGETQTKSNYSWSTYKYCNGTNNVLTKYNDEDKKTELDIMDDAATVLWGARWKMPTKEQIAELSKGVLGFNYRSETLNDVKCMHITSSVTTESIYLPFSGYFEGTELKEDDSYYWSSTLNPTFWNREAFRIWFNNTMFNVSSFGTDRCDGLPIRPVLVQESKVQLSETRIVLPKNGGAYLAAYIQSAFQDNPNVTWKSSNTSIARVTGNGKVGSVFAVTTTGGKCTITATLNDGSGAYAECEVYVETQHEWVDLGLPSGTLWATCNLGASIPESHGYYYAWGETTTKSSYTWSNYKYCNGSNRGMTKYCNSSSYGTVDKKTELEPEDDAATANWGGIWQMPSTAQFEELINTEYVTRTYEERDGIKGLKITSKKNGSSIFLPVGGYYDNQDWKDSDGYGYYWTRTLDFFDNRAETLCFCYGQSIYTTDSNRCYGLIIRPVVKK